MKKIVLLIGFLLAVIVSYGQPTGSQQANNITIRNDAPMLHLRGEGANINFYNGDLRLTRSSNILTLTGGIFKIGTDTAATQAYARTYGGGATYPPAGIPLSTGAAWGTSITNTTVGNNFLGLTNPSAITFPRINADNTVTALSATNFKAALDIETDVGNQIHDTIAAGIDLGTVVPYQADTVPKIVFGTGAGLDADSVLFAQNMRCFGVFRQYPHDTLYVVNFINLYITSGDSLKWNCYTGDYMTNTPADSLFDAPQPLGVNQDVITPTRRYVYPGQDVWIGMSGTQLTGMRPKQWALQMNTQTINLTY
jgi:hypothetical protein